MAVVNTHGIGDIKIWVVDADPVHAADDGDWAIRNDTGELWRRDGGAWVPTVSSNPGSTTTGLKRLTSPTQFTADAIANVGVGAQNTLDYCETEDGQIVILYRSGANLKFVVLNGTTYAKDVSETTITTTCNTGTANTVRCVPITGGNNFAVTWVDTTASNQGRFAYYSSAGAVVKAATTFDADCAAVGCTPLADGRVVIGWDDGSETFYRIYDNTGTETEAATSVTTAGTSNLPTLCTLSNDMWVICCEVAASDGNFFVYESTGATSNLQDSGKYCELIDGTSNINEVYPLPNNGFVVVYHDNNSTNFTLASPWEYVNDTTWESTGVVLPLVNQAANEYAGCAAADLSQELFVVSQPCVVRDGQRAGQLAVYTREEMAQIITGYETRTLLPRDIGQGLSIAFRVGILSDRRILAFFQDDSGSDEGTYIVFQLSNS